jgi:hypothetical protein
MQGRSLAESVPGLGDLWRRTTGDFRVVIGVVDGPADLGHPALAGAAIETLDVPPAAPPSPGARAHGTVITSLIFGRHGSSVAGVAPGCRGVLVPAFRDAPGGCTQLDLARAIDRAAARGAAIINVSGGEWTPSGAAGPHLSDAVRRCAERGILIVAAAGNDGCACLHVPAALPGVLAVGAMDERGRSLGSSNWGAAYRRGGLLAPGAGLIGAVPAGGTRVVSGTSPAAAVVSGLVALLLGLSFEGRRRAGAVEIRDILLDSADPCREDRLTCQRRLAGRLNLAGAVARLLGRSRAIRMSLDSVMEVPPDDNGGGTVVAPPTPEPGVVPSSGCGCAACQARAARPELVFALGQLGYDLVSEARRDSLAQHMGGADPADPAALLKHLEAHPWEAESVIWTLNLDQTPIYALHPAGPFAAPAYEMMRKALDEQVGGHVERVSVPGRLDGQARLLNGQTIPVVRPELRGFYSWSTGALVDAVVGPAVAAAAKPEDAEPRRRGVRSFLDRVYHELRNLGATPEERAINYAATNAFQIGSVYDAAIREEMELDSIEVERSPICRPESDCWDVKVHFFYPQRQVQTVRRAYRFTVDVSDIVPVMVGPVRSWFVR